MINEDKSGWLASLSKLQSRGDLNIILREDITGLFQHLRSTNKKIAVHGLEEGFLSLDQILGETEDNFSYDKICVSEGDSEVHHKIRTRNYDAILLVGPHHEFEWLEKIRQVAFSADFQGKIYVIGPVRKLSEKRPYENPLPIIGYCFPCAGTMRFWPQINYMLQECKFKGAVVRDLLVNCRYQYLKGRDLPVAVAQNELEQSVRGSAVTLDYFEYCCVHHPLHLANMRDTGCRIVVLMRDPRDILTSFYYHSISESNDSVDDRLIFLMNGYRRWLERDCYSLLWPSITDLCNSFLTAVTYPEFIVVRFEDLHRDEVGTLKILMSQLGLYPHPLIEMGDSFFEQAALRGSIEYQTGGKRKRGEGHKTLHGGPGHGATSRNGVVGDWKELFTPKVKDYFKHMTGDTIVRLGYEKDMNW